MELEDQQKLQGLIPKLSEAFEEEKKQPDQGNQESVMFYKEIPCKTQREDRKIKYPANLVVIEQGKQLILDFYYFNDMKIRSYTMKHLESSRQYDFEKTYLVGGFYYPPVHYRVDR